VKTNKKVAQTHISKPKRGKHSHFSEFLKGKSSTFKFVKQKRDCFMGVNNKYAYVTWLNDSIW
jgi:hypothetical protein